MQPSASRLRALIAPLLVMMTSVAACASDPGPQPGEAGSSAPPDRSTSAPASSTPASPTPEERDDPSPAAAVPEVLRFTAPQLGGGTVEGSSFAGSDLALWFWAPW